VGTPPGEARLAIQELAAEAVRRRMAGIRGVGLPPEVDAAAAAATAEAFDGCVLLRRTDRLVSSLAPGDPLQDTLGMHGGPLLGIHATTVAADQPSAGLRDALLRERATLWLARVEQVSAVASDGAGSGSPAWARLAAVVVPLRALGDLPDARAAADRFREVTGVEVVTAYAPPEAGGLVAMNTPVSRRGGDHETTCDAGSVGRVVNGVVVWPAASMRQRLGFQALPGIALDRSVVIGATLPCPDGAACASPRAALLPDLVSIDEEGFIRAPEPVPGG
jgi:hypothetical protein